MCERVSVGKTPAVLTSVVAGDCATQAGYIGNSIGNSNDTMQLADGTFLLAGVGRGHYLHRVP